MNKEILKELKERFNLTPSTNKEHLLYLVRSHGSFMIFELPGGYDDGLIYFKKPKKHQNLKEWINEEIHDFFITKNFLPSSCYNYKLLKENEEKYLEKQMLQNNVPQIGETIKPKKAIKI